MNMANKKENFHIFLAGSIAIFIAILIRIYFFQTFIIPSNSMYPSLHIGDKILVMKSPFTKMHVNRLDIIVFRDNNNSKSLVKRVVGIERDNITIENGLLFINGEKIKNIKYNFDKDEYHNVTVQKNQLYVLGDNGIDSIDSRVFGAIDIQRITGKVFFIFSPISRMHFIQ